MSLYTERWTARPAWLALSIRDRLAFLDRIGPEMERFVEAGAELLGVALRETTLLHRSDCTYVAFWSMPEGDAQMRQLDDILAAAGWADYFERAEPTPVEPRSVRPATITNGSKTGRLVSKRLLKNGTVG